MAKDFSMDEDTFNLDDEALKGILAKGNTKAMDQPLHIKNTDVATLSELLEILERIAHMLQEKLSLHANENAHRAVQSLLDEGAENDAFNLCDEVLRGILVAKGDTKVMEEFLCARDTDVAILSKLLGSLKQIAHSLQGELLVKLAYKDNRRAVQELLDQGAEVEAQDTRGNWALLATSGAEYMVFTGWLYDI